MSVKIEYIREGRDESTRTLARFTSQTVAGLVCDLWCYEDKFGAGEPNPQADGSLILKHRRRDNPETQLTTHLTPGEDSVESRVTATALDEMALRSVRRINACWQFRRSDRFGNRGHFVKDFVSRCFVHIDQGFVRLTDTSRFPDTRRPADDPRNSPPWVQRYVPAWEDHPGQPEASWGNSEDRPTISLVGIVSRDGEHLAAWGCRRASGIGQGWHDCLHLLPDLTQDYDATSNRLESRSVFYFMENDLDRLLARYKSDFQT